MPIHLLWGDDYSAREVEIKCLIDKIIDPAWISINLSRLDGSDNLQAAQALEEARTPPFGSGGRIILVKKSPFCNTCSKELAKSFEIGIELIPNNTHLILTNDIKPDGRLKTTKALQKIIKSNQAIEKGFCLPAIWDIEAQKKLIEKIANQLELSLEREASIMLVEALGNDSLRIRSELEKLALLADNNSASGKERTVISKSSISHTSKHLDD